VQPDELQRLLLLSLFLPIVGAGLTWALADLGQRVVRRCALLVTVLTVLAAGVVVFHFPTDPAEATQYAAYHGEWFNAAAGIDIGFDVGLDGLSLWLYGLSALLLLTCVLVSWEAVTDRPAAFYGLLLLLGGGMLGVFAAKDIVLFYVFFEFTLIPLFFLIGGWGSEERRHAAIKFFLFTLTGSVLTFLSLLAIVIWVWNDSGRIEMTFSIPELTAYLTQKPMDLTTQMWIFLGLFAGFAIKVPLFPLHTWLPLAHTQAPTAGSVVLAGVLLKIGTYGFLRFSLPMLPQATAACAGWLLWLSVAGIMYGALVALAQSDMKRLIAYSSVSHLGFCMLGIFALNSLGVQGGALQMINHGLSTGGLFAVIGMLYERYHTRRINDLGGLARRMPLLALMMLLFTFSSIGLPGLNGFAGEFPLLLGMFQRGWAETPAADADSLKVIAVLAVTGVVLGAWYMLWMVQRVFFGPLKEANHTDADPPVRDLSLREFAALAPLLVFVFWIGLYPKYFLDTMSPALEAARRPAAEALEKPTASPPALASDGDNDRGVQR
jgi:NADH-quinone oxidoreductase subunit M